MKFEQTYLSELRSRGKRCPPFGEFEGVGKQGLKAIIKGFLDAGIENKFIPIDVPRWMIDEA
ncbi:MAG: hypothetical protein P8L31_10005 [Pseudomonadales bacterium]|jgi:hypothetical protein|nr:hypothetical protein [Pseudomonadales bacterium]